MKILFVSTKFEGTLLGLSDCDPEESVLMVDIDRCISCGTCGLACQMETGKDAAHPGSCRRIKAAPEQGGENGRMITLPLMCRHCAAPCEYHSQYNFWITCPSSGAHNEKNIACDFCGQRAEQGLWPACATRCTMKTIYFGPARDILFVLKEKKLREMGDVRICGS